MVSLEAEGAARAKAHREAGALYVQESQGLQIRDEQEAREPHALGYGILGEVGRVELEVREQKMRLRRTNLFSGEEVHGGEVQEVRLVTARMVQTLTVEQVPLCLGAPEVCV